MAVTVYPGISHKRWLPSELSGLAGWWRADAITGLVDGDPVPQVNDQSGNARHLVQATVAKQPTYKTSIINGKPVMRFDGTDDIMATAAFVELPQPNTIFIVGKSSNNGYFFDGISSSKRQTIGKSAGATLWLMFAGATMSGGSANTNNNILSVVFSGASSQLYENGTLEVSGDPSNAGLTGVTLGGRFDATSLLIGDIAEVLVYNSLLSSANRQAVQRYLSNKYALAVAS